MADGNEPYSNLEVAPTEHAEQSPEIIHDPAAFAPERDFSSDTPTVKEREKWPLTDSLGEHPSLRPTSAEKDRKPSETAPETGYKQDPDIETLKEASQGGDTPRFAPPPISGEHKIENAPPGEPQKTKKRRRGVIFWLLIALIALLILAIALGVGLGVGLTRNNSQPATTSAPPSAPTTLPHGLKNGTSMAVIALPNGDKRLFFQENEGNIREALYSNSSTNWTSNVNDLVATNAKNATPIAALLINNTGTSSESTGTNIYLFYIANNNQLASRIFVSGTWTTRDNFSPNEETNITFTTPPNSSALAATPNTNSTTPGATFVFYVAQNGSAECVAVTPDNSDGIVARPGPSLPAGVQGGNVLTLAAGVSTGSNVRPQVGVLTSNGTAEYYLYFSFFANGAWGRPELQTVLVPPLPANQQPSVPPSLTLADAYPITATMTPLPAATADPSKQSAAYNQSLLGDVNIAQVFVPTVGPSSTGYTLFGFWVNGTNLAAYTTKNIGLSGAPKSSFPFTRLAGTLGATGSGNVFLFHQMNQTSVAQDVYSTNGGFFETTFFDISTS